MVRVIMMLRFVYLLLLVVAVGLLVAGCSGEPEQKDEQRPVEIAAPERVPAEPEFRSIMPTEAQALIEREKDILVVDVRTPEERAQLRIPGSVAVSLTSLMQGQEQLPKDKPLLLVCAVGGRSYAAGLYLVKENYPRVYNLRGGIHAWQKAGLPLEYGSK